MSQFQNEIEEIFSEKGLLSNLSKYEYRKPQQKMAAAVANSLENSSHNIIEAPTGIGKSFAYLVPSIIFSLSKKRKAVISTCTINLQEQLIKKDIPSLQKILPYDFTPEILKGRQNYICTKRLNNALLKKSTLFVTEEQEELQKIYNYVNKNGKGTIQDIPFKIGENIWSQIFAEEGVCTSKSCGSENSNCFYQHAKTRIKKADIIILNHYLFFTIFGLFETKGNGYIYSDDFVIFDEAHQIEQIAAENASPSISKEQIRFWLNKLYNPQKDKGFLVDSRFRKLTRKVSQLLAENDSFFTDIERFAFDNFINKRNNKLIRIRDPFKVYSSLVRQLDDFSKELLSVLKLAQNDDEENEIKNHYKKLNAFANTTSDFLNHSIPDHVYWIELSKGYRRNTKLCMSPIDMAEFFRNNIFNDNGPVIMTSATLSVNRSLEYFKKSVGSEAENGLILDSSFDFGKQMKIFISKNVPEPLQNKLEPYSTSQMGNDYEKTLKKKIEEGILKTGGGALVLFTNIKLMKNMFGQISNSMRGKDIEFYAQGEGLPKMKLLKEFGDDLNAVLFGVDSFWMGIDIPGDSLRNVIITKLPFEVPDHPITEARLELIQKRGGNPFMDYYLPGAILKFKQGVGRLIRNKTDVGIINILDSRILHKFYGKLFINSLPECEVIVEN
jgi:ATP-dependent DNA helicase DinG